jgi:antitoxin ParD1/3/4
MSLTKKLDVAVEEDLVPFVDAAVASGEYDTPSDVVNDALRVWRHARDAGQLDVDTLRRLWREGVNSGVAVDAEPEFKRLLEKYSAAER